VNKQKNRFNHVIEEITRYVEGILKSRNDTLGLSIALTNDKDIIWAQGFGFTNSTKKDRVTANTLFSSQSIGKCFTATAFLIMTSKGLINLDDPIQKYYPEFKINTIYGIPMEEILKITFRRMLSHRAGLTHEALVGNNYDLTPCSFEEHIQSISEGWLKSQVGSEMSYSNLGYDLTGYVMGLIKNKSFKEVMYDELFQPLRMTNATYCIEEALRKPFARGYDGMFAYSAVQIPMLAAGGLFISVLDIAKLIAFHLRNGKINNEQIIDPDLLLEMYKPQFIESKEFGYGLGIYSTEKLGQVNAYGHAGGGYGYQTKMLWLPNYNIGVAVLSNNMKHSRVGDIAQKVLELIIKDLEKDAIKPISLELLKALEGTYCADGNLGPQILRISVEHEKTYVYDMSGNRIEIFAKSPTKFLSKNGTKYSFELDKNVQPAAIYVDDVFPYKAKYNEGPNDGLGPNKKEWQEYTGIYKFEEGSRPNYLGLSVINGFLFLIFRDNLKLSHHKNEVWFTVDGEALILAHNELNYKGIHAKKIDFDITKFLDNLKNNKIKFDYYSKAISSLVNILNNLQGFKYTFEFLEKIIQIDKEFNNNMASFGKRLYSSGKVQEAIVCFTKVLDIDPENNEAKEIIDKIDDSFSRCG
jgi:CubicO group peptidase (beta-lactamase class C family)